MQAIRGSTVSRACAVHSKGPVRSVAALAFLVETLYLARRFCGLRWL